MLQKIEGRGKPLMPASRGPRIYMWADEAFKAKFEEWRRDKLDLDDNGKALRFLADQAMEGERDVTAREQEFLDEMLAFHRKADPASVKEVLNLTKLLP